jgi:hypothetical protein
MIIDISIYDNLTSQNRGLFSDIIINPVITENFRLRKHPNELVDRWLLTENRDYTTYNICMYGVKNYGDDHIVNITSFAKELLNRDFNSILIAGMRIGLLPYICKNAGIETDVVEISQEIINIVNPLGYLNGANIINDNIFTFTPTKQYDVILLDIWNCDCDSNFDEQMTELIAKYNQYLNEGGIIYIPINKNGTKLFNKT